MITIIDCGSTKTPAIVDSIQQFHPVNCVSLNELNADTILNADAIIISGAPILLTEIDQSKYTKQFEWIKSFHKPLLGICFGHQIIGLIYSASISKQREDRTWNEVEIICPNPLFEGLEAIHSMMEDHCESISVPIGFKLAATSDTCVNEAMFHEHLPYFGVQFHPEVSGKNGLKLLENFVKIVEATVKLA